MSKKGFKIILIAKRNAMNWLRTPTIHTRIDRKLSFLAMVKTSLVDKEYTEWKNKPQANRTWADFKSYWADVWSDYEDIQEITVKEAGFGKANAAVTNAVAVTEALEGLANAAAVDKTTVETLTATNATFVEEVKKEDELISKLTVDNSRLITILA